MKILMTGNEAVARGAYEAGCHFGSAYPGTPSTEIMENLASYHQVYCEWSANEKTALETSIGASIAGCRAMTAMKHVGLNVAADPLFTTAYEGVNGGLVIVSADDPGMHSSQNEQDNRMYARHAKIAMLEPSDSQECLEFTKLAFEISERFDTPVLLRLTTTVCHSRSMVDCSEPLKIPVKPYIKNTAKYVPVPRNAFRLHCRLEEKLKALAGYAEMSPANHLELNDTTVGVITSGISFQYVKEVLGTRVSILKLGFTHPLPGGLIRRFASHVKDLYVVEENEPYLEKEVKALGIPCKGKDLFPVCGELNPGILQSVFFPERMSPVPVLPDPPVREPLLCAGCPYRGIFYTLGKYPELIVTNDIGCYTLGMAMPAKVTDTCVCMGGGFTVGAGMDRAFRIAGSDKKVAGIVGDSTFFHSGITGLLSSAWNHSNMIMIILDNGTTAMTGRQENPGTGTTLSGEISRPVSIASLVRACGIGENNLRVVDPLDLTQTQKALQDAHLSEELFVIIAARPCGAKSGQRCVGFYVNTGRCVSCGECMELGCPAMTWTDSTPVIDPYSCAGCGLCSQICALDAIRRESD